MKDTCGDFPDGSVVKISTSKAGDVASIPSGGAKFPHAFGPKKPKTNKQTKYIYKTRSTIVTDSIKTLKTKKRKKGKKKKQRKEHTCAVNSASCSEVIAVQTASTGPPVKCTVITT